MTLSYFPKRRKKKIKSNEFIGLIWHTTKNELPPDLKIVLGWDSKRGYSICKRVDRKDCKKGTYWIVNGSSGGIGTRFEIKPPVYWCELPEPPI